MMVAVLSTQALPHSERKHSNPAPVALTGLGTALPRHQVDGSELLATLAAIWPRLNRRIHQLSTELDGGTRHLVRPADEFARPLSLDDQRSRYIEEATALAEAAADRALAAASASRGDVGLLVVASCTGFVLPGVDVHLVQRLGLRQDVRRLPLAHFGCAGGAAALAHAAEWVRGAKGRQALVVAVEVPSITFRPGDTSADNLLSALVFGDGASAAVLAAEAASVDTLRLGRSASTLVAGTRDALGFEVVSDGFRVAVSRRLPQLIAAHLPALVGDFLDVPASALDVVAIHPGGRAIVDAVAECLGLSAPQVAATRRSLERSGNTSSAALLFVLADLAANPPAPAGRGMAMAFGPGLTVELIELGWGC